MTSNKKTKIVTVCIAGYFDPIHGGHLDHIEKAKALGDKLVVIAGTERQCDDKPSHKGKHFLSWNEKVRLLIKLGANQVVPNIDTDGTCADTLRYVKPDIFAKGEDFNPENLPKRESEVCNEIKCEIRFGVGRRLNESRRFWSDK